MEWIDKNNNTIDFNEMDKFIKGVKSNQEWDGETGQSIYNFMNNETFEQVSVSSDVIGDQSVYLQENMTCVLSMFEGRCVAIQLPARVTIEIVDTEPSVKGQTASSSYKPATLSNGARTMVPPHITAGTRVVIMTEDGSYVERAKD